MPRAIRPAPDLTGYWKSGRIQIAGSDIRPSLVLTLLTAIAELLVFELKLHCERYCNFLLCMPVYVKRRCCTTIIICNFCCCFDEGISLDQVKKSSSKDLVAGAAPMPREMSFPLGASESWSDVYDYIRCSS